MKAARKSSIAIPEQISVTGFDDVPAASLTEPPLTTVALPAYEMGRRGMQMLLANLGAPRDFPLIEERPTSLVIRASVAQLKKSEGFREVGAVGLRQSGKLPRA
jgi:DNA-binding LacI/PurR family transcriptional regulator